MSQCERGQACAHELTHFESVTRTTFNCSSHCKCDSCVAAGCFNESITRAELPLSFSLCDHAHCRSAHEIELVERGVVLHHTCALQTQDCRMHDYDAGDGVRNCAYCAHLSLTDPAGLLPSSLANMILLVCPGSL